MQEFNVKVIRASGLPVATKRRGDAPSAWVQRLYPQGQAPSVRISGDQTATLDIGACSGGQKLRERGVQLALLTGDNARTAQRIVEELGIGIVLPDVLPGQKAYKIKELQAQRKKVGMVGDGVNDAPALTQADVGFAIGAGTDVVLMKSGPHDVVGAIKLSSATLRKMHQNLFWAGAYNVVAFPAAAGVFYPCVVSPEVAALAMSGSSALVAVNALLLKRTRLEGIATARPATKDKGA